MSGTWGEWFEGAKVKTKEFAEKAQVIAEAASKVAHSTRDTILFLLRVSPSCPSADAPFRHQWC